MAPQSVDKRLAKFIKKTDSCWLWQGRLDNRGYGVFTCYGQHMAHRFVYEYLVGPIPEGLQLDHLCCVKDCVNPDHLEPVTAQENRRRYTTTITHCPKGHPYAGDNLYINPTNKSRHCKTCNRDANRIRYQKKSGFRGNQEPGKNKEGKRKRKSSNGTA